MSERSSERIRWRRSSRSSRQSRMIQGPSSSATPTPVAKTARPRPPTVASTPPDANRTPSPTTSSTPPTPARTTQAGPPVGLLGVDPHEGEAHGREDHRPHDRRRQQDPDPVEQQHQPEGQQTDPHGPFRRRRRTVVGGDGAAARRTLGGQQRPAGQVEDGAEAVGHREHHQGQPHGERVDAQVAGHAAGHAGHDPLRRPSGGGRPAAGPARRCAPR